MPSRSTLNWPKQLAISKSIRAIVKIGNGISLRVVKIGDLFEVHEDRLFVVANDPWHFHFRIIDSFHVAIDDGLQILAELFLGLQELTHDGSVEKENCQFQVL